PDVASTLEELAVVALQRGALSVARKDVDEAETIYRRGKAAQDPSYLANVVVVRGDIEMRERNYRSARDAFDEARALRDRIFGPSHPLSARSRASIATADFALGNHPEAIETALDAERISREYSQSTIRFLPERQAMTFAAQRPHSLDLALSTVAGGHADDITPIVDAVVRSRGVVLNELAARAHDQKATNSALGTALLKARQRYANLAMRSLDGSDPTLLKLLDEARREKEQAERALVEEGREDSANRTIDVGIRDVQDALPENSAIVAFSRYERTADASKPTRPAYMVFVIKHDEPSIRAFSLGSAQTLDDLVNAWRVQARAPAAEQAYAEAALRLRRRIWDPIAPMLSGATRVFIVPDGSINFVTFAALPGAGGKYLLETGPQFHYLTAERDLIRPETTTANKGLLAIGGAAFDGAPAARAVASLRSSCVQSGSLQFPDLPGTRDEILEVARIWRATGDTTTLLSGAQATKRATIRALANRRVVHLATHGFFLDDRCRPSVPSTRAVGGLVSSSARARAVETSPLVLSGLALAGANNAAKRPAADDGILTAEEVASLDISGTEWVVLSACDTGLGEIAVGEGVVGLRRAFHIAGARTVIMSLWSVEDQSARAWMRELYNARFTRHLTTSDAMRAAALRVLAERRSRGESSHPFYWAGFVAVGDWR
ncbi:MAG TPA: CHAT domain-containing tetratricopeptide repeat protein, partial [Vicinamibacterales bacterium]|nr:CHAT domain-containing tetratricopeptide repeat protein [Vicinamibacterales bacterium]